MITDDTQLGLTSDRGDFIAPSEVFRGERKGKNEAPILSAKRGVNKPGQRHEIGPSDDQAQSAVRMGIMRTAPSLTLLGPDPILHITCVALDKLPLWA